MTVRRTTVSTNAVLVKLLSWGRNNSMRPGCRAYPATVLLMLGGIGWGRKRVALLGDAVTSASWSTRRPQAQGVWCKVRREVWLWRVERRSQPR